jgi:hypothetical protein
MSFIPSNILNKMSKQDREDYALRHGQGPVAVMTTSELSDHVSKEAEKALQKQIKQLLEAVLFTPGLPAPVGVSRMDKPSTMPVGWPDFTFCYRGRFTAWECKTASGKTSKEQNAFRESITRNGGTWRVIRSVAEAQEHLREIDQEINPGPSIK